MKKVIGRALILACLLGGCSNGARHSLVGAWDIEPDPVLAGETSTLWFRKYGPADIHQTLSYTLDPQGILNIERGRDRTTCCYGGVDHHFSDGMRRVKLSAEGQREIRRLLARLRPDHLSKDGPFALPVGCDFISDGGAWAGVAFQRGEASGAFIFQPDCKGKGADQVKDLLRSIVEKLPKVNGSSTFVATE